VKRLGLRHVPGRGRPGERGDGEAGNGVELHLPVVPAPGQKAGTIAIALGYGRGENGEKVGKAACLHQ
jgi:hypothetical protein